MTRGGLKMPWRPLGTVRNMKLHEPSSVTAPALATAPRNRERGCKAERLECSRWPYAPVQREPCECAWNVFHGNDSLGFPGRRVKVS